MSKFKNYPALININIMSKFILEVKNALEIHKFFLAYKIKISYPTVTYFLKWIRTAISHYLKDFFSFINWKVLMVVVLLVLINHFLLI